MSNLLKSWKDLGPAYRRSRADLKQFFERDEVFLAFASCGLAIVSLAAALNNRRNIGNREDARRARKEALEAARRARKEALEAAIRERKEALEAARRERKEALQAARNGDGGKKPEAPKKAQWTN